jgi:ribosomal protein L12E/L44/L45/RPP1/RPP2
MHGANRVHVEYATYDLGKMWVQHITFFSILQVPDSVKRERADHVIDTGCRLEDTEAQVAALLSSLKGKAGHVCQRLLEKAQEEDQTAAAAAAEGQAVSKGRAAAAAAAAEQPGG